MAEAEGVWAWIAGQLLGSECDVELHEDGSFVSVEARHDTASLGASPLMLASLPLNSDQWVITAVTEFATSLARADDPAATRAASLDVGSLRASAADNVADAE